MPLRLAERLPPSAELRLGLAVSSVSLNESSGEITVAAKPVGAAASAGGGAPAAFRCTGSVVLALPPALWAATIAFEPSLPSALSELAQRTPTWMARTAKTLVRYETPFWRKKGFAGVGFSRAGPLSEIHDHSGDGAGAPAMLFGFSQGPRKPERDAVVAQLVRIFGPEAASPVSVLTHDWSEEEFTFGPRGSGAAGPEGRGDLQSAYGNPAYARGAWGGRLQFCSTETGRDSPGHIEGALEAAERAVGAIISSAAAQQQKR